jgi:uncharacterized membrane protein YccC
MIADEALLMTLSSSINANLEAPLKGLVDRILAALNDQVPAAVIFSLKTFAAGLLALYLAFWLGLDEPKWAIMTVFIVSQPDSGMVLAKSFFRLLGTVAGALVSTGLVFSLSQYGALFLASIAAWIGLCNFAARAVRNFNSYGFLLAGYSTAIIGIPAALNTGGAYPLILARFTEISLGIACAGLMSRLILPRDMTSKLLVLTRELSRRAERLATLAINSPHRPGYLAAERVQLVKDLAAAEAMRSSAFFESTETRLLDEALRHRLDAALHLIAMAEKPLPERCSTLCPDFERPRKLASLIAASDDTPWGNGAMVSTLLQVNARRAFDAALVQLYRSEAAFYLGSSVSAPRRARRLWSDPMLAALTGVRSALAVAITSAFWVVTAWPTGATAVIIVATACSLLASLEQPVIATLALAPVVLIAIAPVFTTLFYLLPLASDFPSMAAALAPLLLTCGFLMAVPGLGPFGLFVVVYFCVVSNIDNVMPYDSAGFLNSSLAILVGIGAAVVMFATFFPETPARLERRFRRQLFVQLCRFCRTSRTSLQEFERALCEYLAATLQRIKEEPAIAKCVAETVATLSTARAIDKLRSPTSTDRLTPEITADLSVLLKRIAKTPFRQGRASFTRSAWEARLLRHRALALARATENAEDIDVLGTVVVGCETLRSGLLKARLLVPDNSDVR